MKKFNVPKYTDAVAAILLNDFSSYDLRHNQIIRITSKLHTTEVTYYESFDF